MAKEHIDNFDSYPVEKEDKNSGLLAKYFPNPDGKGPKGIIVKQICKKLTMDHMKKFQEDLES